MRERNKRWLLVHLNVAEDDQTGIRVFDTERDRDITLDLVRRLPGAGRWKTLEVSVTEGEVLLAIDNERLRITEGEFSLAIDNERWYDGFL